jgi:hypothetical protein
MTDDEFDGVHVKPITALIRREFETTPGLTPEQFAGLSGLELHRVEAIAAGRPITLTEAEFKQAEDAYRVIGEAYWHVRYRREGWIFPKTKATGPYAALMNLPKPPPGYHKRIRPKTRLSLREIALGILGLLFLGAIAAGMLLFFVADYVNCFNATLPAGTGIGHFERCVLGIREVDESLQRILSR